MSKTHKVAVDEHRLRMIAVQYVIMADKELGLEEKTFLIKLHNFGASVNMTVAEQVTKIQTLVREIDAHVARNPDDIEGIRNALEIFEPGRRFSSIQKVELIEHAILAAECDGTITMLEMIQVIRICTLVGIEPIHVWTYVKEAYSDIEGKAKQERMRRCRACFDKAMIHFMRSDFAKGVIA